MNGNGKPEKKFRVGGVSAAIFRWTNTTRDGKTFSQAKVVPDRAYRDKDGQWQNVNSYDANDIPKVVMALVQAYAYLLKKDDTEANGDGVPVEEVN